MNKGLIKKYVDDHTKDKVDKSYGDNIKTSFSTITTTNTNDVNNNTTKINDLSQKKIDKFDAGMIMQE